MKAAIVYECNLAVAFIHFLFMSSIQRIFIQRATTALIEQPGDAISCQFPCQSQQVCFKLQKSNDLCRCSCMPLLHFKYMDYIFEIG